MLKVGLIGCGGMGSFHANCYGALRNCVEIAAVADLDAEKVKNVTAKYGGKGYASGAELLAEADVDIIDICLPTYLHAEYAIKAMEKGCDVFMEKPVCLNLQEAQQLLDVQAKTGRKVQIGQVVRFMDEYVWLKKAYESGKYGKILSAVFTRISSNPRWSWNNWYNKPELSGSMATDLHIHDVDFIRYLLGEPDEVCSSKATRGSDGAIEQLFTTYRFGDTIVTSEGCWDYPDCFPFQAAFRVKLEQATVVYDGATLTVFPTTGEKFVPELAPEFEQEADEAINVSSLGGYYNELKCFVESIINDRPIETAPLIEAVKSLALDRREIELAGGVQEK